MSVVFAVAAVGACLAPARGDQQAQIDFANGLFVRGFNAEAAAEYRAYLEQYPDGAHVADALYRLGESELAQGRSAEALDAFDKFLARYSTHALAPVVQGRKGVALYNLKRYDESIEALKAGASGEASPDVRGAALYFMGKAHFEAKRAPDAIAAFNTLIETLPESPYTPAARYQLAYVFLSQDKIEQAAVAFSELAGSASAAEELRREARFRAAESYDQLGWYDASVRAYEQLQAEFPGSEHAQRAEFGHAWALYHATRYEESASLGQKFLAAHPDSAQALGMRYLVANCFQQLGKNSEALTLYRDVQERDPKSDYAARSQFKEGVLLHATGDAAAAKPVLDGFLARDAKTGLEADARYVLGMIAYEARNFDESAALFQQCIESDPPGAYRRQAVFQLAQTRLDQGQFAEARDRFAAFAAENADDALAVQSLLQAGDSAFHAGDYAGAEVYFAQAADKSQGELRQEALYRVAVARHNGAKRAESAEAFEKLLAEFAEGPHAVEAHLRAGQYWLSDAKEPLRAIPHFEAALAQTPEGTSVGEALKGLGLARYESKDMEGAAQTFVKLIEQAPDVALNETAYAWAGQYLFDRERWAEAALALQALLDHVPDYPDRPRVRLKIGECFERADNLDAALKQYEGLAADSLDTPAAGEARFRVAGIYEKKGDTARAVELYEQVAVAAVNGDMGARAQFRLGELRTAEGKFAEAARHYMRVAILYLHPELSSEALWRAGQCFEQGGDKEQAVRSYEEVVRDHPESEQAAKAKDRLAALAA